VKIYEKQMCNTLQDNMKIGLIFVRGSIKAGSNTRLKDFAYMQSGTRSSMLHSY